MLGTEDSDCWTVETSSPKPEPGVKVGMDAEPKFEEFLLTRQLLSSQAEAAARMEVPGPFPQSYFVYLCVED